MSIKGIIAALLLSAVSLAAYGKELPHNVFVGNQRQHVQGIAYDAEKGLMYMSFTSRFLKVDMQGNILASIDRIQGHLGALSFDPVSRKVFASLECKDDEIGQGIAKTLSIRALERSDSKFYIAVIDVDSLNCIGVNPERNEAFKTVCLRKVIEDYAYSGEYEHRYGCSGIDGVTIAPGIGVNSEKLYLYVAYGIYSDVNRSDNDYQVIQRYDIKGLVRRSRPLVFGESHTRGPRRPDKEYFIRTGNTAYGVQNLAYDPYTDCFFMAVYRGSKPEFPNYSLFAFDRNQQPFRSELIGSGEKRKVMQLRLSEGRTAVAKDGSPQAPLHTLKHAGSGIGGWNFKYGSTGLCPIGKGLWYIARSGRDKASGEYCDATLFRWTGEPEGPFGQIEAK